MKKILTVGAMLLSGTFAQAERNDSNQIVNAIQTNVQLQEGLKKCPADYKIMDMDKALIVYGGQPSLCKNNQKQCYKKCLKSNAGACYFLALDLQSINKKQEAEALFQKGCEAGLAVACTNRAAGIQFYAMQTQQKISPKQDKCITRAFKNACQAKDPWGCTMFGQKLYEGQGITKNIAQALKVFDLSCKYGVSSDACQQALILKSTILKKSE